MNERIALVTGGNRGLGYEICRGLGRAGLIVLLGARSGKEGETAAKALRDEGLDVRPLKLDVSKEKPIRSVYDDIMREHKRLDVLVNNAGVYLDVGVNVLDVPYDTVRETFETNFFGAFLLSQLFIPIMQQLKYGRVVNMSSDVAGVSRVSASTAAYKLSKLALNMMTRAFAEACAADNVKVNTMSPGWVQTRMGGEGAPRTVEEGADTAIWLATLPDSGPTGGFFRDRQPVAW